MSLSTLPEKFEPALPHISIVAPPNFYFTENGNGTTDKKQKNDEEECGEDEGNPKGLGWFVASLFVVSNNSLIMFRLKLLFFRSVTWQEAA